MNTTTNDNWIYFIGIGGVTTAPLAVALQNQGYKVSGSDKNLYDPIKSFLEENRIQTYKNFSFKNLISNNETPGIVVCGSGISLNNKEYLFAKKQNLNIKHFPEIINELIVDKNSLVVAGSYAKTTITSMLVSIFKESHVNISYMYGGLPINGENTFSLKDNTTKLSIIEGDEYISSRWDTKSKFFYYKPKFLVITGIKWDHADVFPTEQDYIENFRNLIKLVPSDGIIFANLEDENTKSILEDSRCKVIDISYKSNNEWALKEGIKTSLIGELNFHNTVAAAKVAFEMGISIESIKKALVEYQGIRRRLQIRKFKENKFVIIDDFASSPAKVESSIRSLKQHYKNYKTLVIFEPNFGNRTIDALEEFKNVFNKADLVILPNFTEVKSDNYPVDENHFKSKLEEKGIKVKIFDTDVELGKIVTEQKRNNEPIVIAFLSSHGMEDRIRLVSDLFNE